MVEVVVWELEQVELQVEVGEAQIQVRMQVEMGVEGYPRCQNLRILHHLKVVVVHHPHRHHLVDEQ
jgi:hypothetical protein